MEFKENDKAIYLQIADRIADDIMSGVKRPGDRIPSVRAFAADMEVNANTVMRAYDYLSSHDIISNRRGIGYYISAEAPAIVRRMRKDEFMADRLDELFRRLSLLDITPAALAEMYEKYLKQS